MTPERCHKVKKIFQAALDRAPEERSAFVSGTCAGDGPLRQEVESLLAAQGKDGSFIDSPAYRTMGTLTKDGDLEHGAGQPAERQILGGESHTYQITLQAGQFVRVVAEQRGVDLKLVLSGPDGKQLVESDLTGIIRAHSVCDAA